MSLGQYKPVSVCFPRISRINIHFFKIQIRKNICCRQGSTRMTCLCAVDSRYDALTHFIGHFL